MGLGRRQKSNRHYFMEQPDLSGIYRQRRGMAGESRYSQRRIYTLFYYNQRRNSGHSLGYTDRGGVDLLRTVEYGNAHDGKCRTAHWQLAWNASKLGKLPRPYSLYYRTENQWYRAPHGFWKKEMGSFVTWNDHWLQCRRLFLCQTTDWKSSSSGRAGYQQLGRFGYRSMDRWTDIENRRRYGRRSCQRS